MSDDAPAMIDVLVLLSVRSAVFTLQQKQLKSGITSNNNNNNNNITINLLELF
jgi:hypothetical protein